MQRLERLHVADGYLLVTADHHECEECDERMCNRILLPADFARACPDIRWHPAGRVSRLDAESIHLYAHPDVVPHLHVAADAREPDAPQPAPGWGAWAGFVASGLFLVYTLHAARAPPRRATRPWHYATTPRPRRAPPAPLPAPAPDERAPLAASTTPAPAARTHDDGGGWTQVWSRRNASWC